MKALHDFLTQTIGLDAAFANELQLLFIQRSYKKKETLVSEGSVCHFIAWVATGTLRSFITHNGDEFNNDFYFAGDIASAYTSFLTGEVTNCTIEAIADTEVYLLSVQHYQDLIAKDSEWLKFGKYISDTYFIRKCRRESAFLRLDAAGRLASLNQLYPGIEQKVSQYHIASYLGIKPESLSRIKLLTYINK